MKTCVLADVSGSIGSRLSSNEVRVFTFNTSVREVADSGTCIWKAVLNVSAEWPTMDQLTVVTVVSQSPW